MDRFMLKMRRVAGALLAVVFLCLSTPALAVSGSSTLADSGDQYVVTADWLNMRAGAGTDYMVVEHLRNGTKVTYVSSKSGWWRVRLANGTSGYVDKQYLTPVDASKTGSYTVSASKLALRKEPNTKSKRLAKLPRGTVVYVSRLNGDWGYVSYNGQSGWVAIKYLQKGGNYVSAASVKSGNTYTVICDTLNVRRRAGGTRIDTIKSGTTVRVSRVSGDWAYVSYNKNGRVKDGWVSAKYLG